MIGKTLTAEKKAAAGQTHPDNCTNTKHNQMLIHPSIMLLSDPVRHHLLSFAPWTGQDRLW
jgi:hypothetical protein